MQPLAIYRVLALAHKVLEHRQRKRRQGYMAGNTYYGDQSHYDRSEMFAMGAAAGALIATAVQEVLQRRKKTPLEKVAARAAAIMSDGTDYTRDLQEKAGSYVAGLSKQSRKQIKQGRRQARKQSKQAGK